MRLSPEQTAAAHCLDRHVALTAGAGTGKTSTLVERFVAILSREGASVSRIAAITFTEKAAGELKERIHGELRRLASQAPNRAEAERWRAHLVSLEGARIGTIHGFCASVLREFAVRADLDPSFRVTDEFEATTLLAAAVRDTLFDLVTGRDNAVRRLLAGCEFASLCALVEDALRSRGDIDFISEELNLEAGDIEAIAGKIKAAATAAVTDIVCEILASAEVESLVSRLESVTCEGAGALESMRAGFLEARRECLAARPSARLKRCAAVREVLGRRLSSPREPDAGCQTVKECINRLRDALKGLLELLESIDADDWNETVRGLVDFMGVYRVALERYESAMRENGLIDFDGLLIAARDLITANKTVAGELRDRYGFILVDEFQDTDFVQAALLDALASCGSNLFVVGDREQSIYAFRGARVEVFSRLIHRYSETGCGALHRLSTNRRSVPHIVEFVNYLFGKLMPAPAASDWRPPHETLRPERIGGSGGVEIIMSNGSEGLDGARRVEARAVAERIRDIVESGSPKVAERAPGGTLAWRAPGYGDVAILLRSMSSAEIYEQELTAAGVPYHTISGATFYARQEVRDVINFLRFVIDPDDTLSLVAALRSPLFAVSDDLLALLACRAPLMGYFTDTPVEGDSPDCDAFRRAVSLVRRLRAVANRVPARTVIDVLFEETAFPAALSTLHSGDQRAANVLKLRDSASSFDASVAGTLDEFVANLSHFETDQTRESEALTAGPGGNLVTIMTIHNSKGLEFPIVVVADLGRKSAFGRTNSGLRIDRKLGISLPSTSGVQTACESAVEEVARQHDRDEENRIFFVAMTRARDHLILSGAASGRGGEPAVAPGGFAGKLLDALGLDLAWPQSRRFDGFSVEFCAPDKPARAARRGRNHLLAFRDRLLAGSDIAGELPAWAPAILERARPLPPAPRLRFTATEIADFNACPLRYELLHLRGLPADSALAGRQGAVVPPARLTGSVLHAALERAGGKHPLAVSLARVLLSNPEWTSLGEPLRRACEPILAKVQESGFYRDVVLAGDAVRENAFSFLLDGFLMEGKIDLCVRGGLVDFKSDDVPADDLAKYAETYRSQMDVYALAFERMFGRPPEWVSVFFLRRAADVRWPYGPTGTSAARERVLAAVNVINAGPPYLPSGQSGQCRCEYATLCSLVRDMRGTKSVSAGA